MIGLIVVLVILGSFFVFGNPAIFPNTTFVIYGQYILYCAAPAVFLIFFSICCLFLCCQGIYYLINSVFITITKRKPGENFFFKYVSNVIQNDLNTADYYSQYHKLNWCKVLFLELFNLRFKDIYIIFILDIFFVFVIFSLCAVIVPILYYYLTFGTVANMYIPILVAAIAFFVCFNASIFVLFMLFVIYSFIICKLILSRRIHKKLVDFVVEENHLNDIQ
jgi:hypothetical protein